MFPNVKCTKEFISLRNTFANLSSCSKGEKPDDLCGGSMHKWPHFLDQEQNLSFSYISWKLTITKYWPVPKSHHQQARIFFFFNAAQHCSLYSTSYIQNRGKRAQCSPWSPTTFAPHCYYQPSNWCRMAQGRNCPKWEKYGIIFILYFHSR